MDTNCDLGFRYQREEAKIQAWVNLQNAKAEAQSRKLEVFLILLDISSFPYTSSRDFFIFIFLVFQFIVNVIFALTMQAS